MITWIACIPFSSVPPTSLHQWRQASSVTCFWLIGKASSMSTGAYLAALSFRGWNGLDWIENLFHVTDGSRHEDLWILLRVIRIYPDSDFLLACIIKVGRVSNFIVAPVPAAKFGDVGAMLRLNLWRWLFNTRNVQNNFSLIEERILQIIIEYSFQAEVTVWSS